MHTHVKLAAAVIQVMTRLNALNRLMCMVSSVPLWGGQKPSQTVHRKQNKCADWSVWSHLSTAELEEYVDVFLVFKMMGEFHHMLVRQGFMEVDLIGYLFKKDWTAYLCAYFDPQAPSRY